jgi:hypothetical protein
VLALFALALQLALGFGHHHSLAAGPFAPVAAAQHQGAADNPAAPDHDDDERNCAICAVVHLLGAAVAAAPPALPLPAAFRPVRIAAAVPTATPSPAAGAFRARAPPEA